MARNIVSFSLKPAASQAKRTLRGMGIHADHSHLLELGAAYLGHHTYRGMVQLLPATLPARGVYCVPNRPLYEQRAQLLPLAGDWMVVADQLELALDAAFDTAGVVVGYDHFHFLGDLSAAQELAILRLPAVAQHIQARNTEALEAYRADPHRLHDSRSEGPVHIDPRGYRLLEDGYESVQPLQRVDADQLHYAVAYEHDDWPLRLTVRFSSPYIDHGSRLYSMASPYGAVTGVESVVVDPNEWLLTAELG